MKRHGEPRERGGGQMARQARRTGGSGKWIAVVVVVLVILGAGGVGAWYFLLRSTPERTLEQFMQASTRGDQEAVKACLSSESLEMADSFGDGMAGMGRGAPRTSAGDDAEKPEVDYTIGSAEVEGDKATVPLTLKMPEGVAQRTGTTEFKINYALVKEEGKWKVDLKATMAEMFRGFGEQLRRQGMQGRGRR